MRDSRSESDAALRRFNMVARLFHMATLGGGRQTASYASWDLSGRCEAPVGRVYHSGRPPSGLHSLRVDMMFACRKCARCRRKRAMHWKERATTECRLACRTWFGTFTYAPEIHQRITGTLRIYAASHGQDGERDFDALPEEEQWSRRQFYYGRLLTLWLKKVRKNAQARFRYLLVAEVHLGGGELHGMPHHHALIHEVHPLMPLRKRILKTAWEWGHSDFRLVKDGVSSEDAAGYACKYIAKSLNHRVRCSIGYGETEYISKAILKADRLIHGELPLLQSPPAPGRGRL